MIAVIDANIALALVLDLAYSAKARQAVTHANSLIAPDLIVHETANALWKISLSEPGFATHAQAAMQALSSLYEEIVSGNDLAPDALAMAISLRHPAYDCFYLALASARAATLITADRKLAAAVKRSASQINVVLVE
jgi:predicted nucleic acid-binding protein